MSNYGEELAYWYLRLNGFFPITNFVIHRDATLRGSQNSDADIVAIRPPNVYEDVGGAPQDWDGKLQEIFDFDRTIGLICQVKTGTVEGLFAEPSIQYTVDRLGLRLTEQERISFLTEPVVTLDEHRQIGKLLIADKRPGKYSHVPFIQLRHVREFIRERMRTYIDAKYGARFFFNSSLIQELIWEVKLEEGEKAALKKARRNR